MDKNLNLTLLKEEYLEKLNTNSEKRDEPDTVPGLGIAVDDVIHISFAILTIVIIITFLFLCCCKWCAIRRKEARDAKNQPITAGRQVLYEGVSAGACDTSTGVCNLVSLEQARLYGFKDPLCRRQSNTRSIILKTVSDTATRLRRGKDTICTEYSSEETSYTTSATEPDSKCRCSDSNCRSKTSITDHDSNYNCASSKRTAKTPTFQPCPQDVTNANGDVKSRKCNSKDALIVNTSETASSSELDTDSSSQPLLHGTSGASSTIPLS